MQLLVTNHESESMHFGISRLEATVRSPFPCCHPWSLLWCLREEYGGGGANFMDAIVWKIWGCWISLLNELFYFWTHYYCTLVLFFHHEVFFSPIQSSFSRSSQICWRDRFCLLYYLYSISIFPASTFGSVAPSISICSFQRTNTCVQDRLEFFYHCYGYADLLW